MTGTPTDPTAASTNAADGLRIRFDSAGSGEPALVLIHGGLCDRSYWAAQVEGLADACRVIALDLPGHGESGTGRHQWTIESFGEDVAQVVCASGARKVVLAGHSMGGPVAIEAARRLGPAVAGVVVLDMLHQPDAKPSPLPPGMGPDEMKAIMRRGMFLPGSDPALQDRVLDAMFAVPPQVAGAMRRALGAYDALAGLRAVAGIPVTLILSELRPIDTGQIRALHPGARVLVVKGAGHFLMMEAPATLNALLRAELLVMSGQVEMR